MLKLHEVTVPQDLILTVNSALTRDFWEEVKIDTLPFGMMWWDWVKITETERN